MFFLTVLLYSGGTVKLKWHKFTYKTMLMYKITKKLISKEHFLLADPPPEILSYDILSLYHQSVCSVALQPCSNPPQSAFNRNGNLRPSPPAAPRLLAPLPQNEPGCFEKWDIAPNGFQTPQKFIRKQGIVKVGGGG